MPGTDTNGIHSDVPSNCAKSEEFSLPEARYPRASSMEYGPNTSSFRLMWTSIRDYIRNLSILGAINVNPYMVKLSAKLPGVAEMFKDLLQLLGCLLRTDSDALPGVRLFRERDVAVVETLLYTVSQPRSAVTSQLYPDDNSPFHNVVIRYVRAAQVLGVTSDALPCVTGETVFDDLRVVYSLLGRIESRRLKWQGR
jgi:hypothetical protein